MTDQPTASAEFGRPLRVLIVEVNEDGTVGGSHQVLLDMATHFDRRIVEPVLLFYQDNRFAAACRDAGLETITWDEVRTRERARIARPGVFRKLQAMRDAVRTRRELLRSLGIDIVHLNNSPRTGIDDWLPAARLEGMPIIASARGDAQRLPGRGVRSMIRRWLVRRFDRVAAVSEYIAEAWRRQGVATDRVVVVHDGVNRAKLATLGKSSTDEVRHRIGVPDGRVFVAMVGNIREWKGQHVLLQAVALLPMALRARLFVCLVGAQREEDQPYRDRLDALIDGAGLRDAVTFTGMRTDVPEIMASADIVVHASVKPEPGGTVVIEAMTFGAPVIVASLGGHLDYLQPGLGLVHDVEQPSQLAAHLAALIDSPDERRRMADGARVRAAEFSIDRTARKMEALYAEILGRRS